MCYRIVSSLTRESTVCYPAIVVVDYEAGYHLDVHWCSTNAARANDLNVHASYRAAWFCGNHRKRGRYFDCTLFLTEESLRFRHCARLSGNFAASTSRRCFDSCPKHLEERLRATSASSQLNDNGYSDVRARITPRRSRGLSRGIAAATSWNPAIGTTAVVVPQNVLLAS